jgi:uncharacterized membrane protein YfcA
MSTLSVLDWSTLLLAALLVGFAKTAVGGAASVSVALFATTLAARESTGALLPLLLLGDLLAVRAYRRHADWAALLRLMPPVGVGVLAGAVFVAHVDDTTMRHSIAATLLALTAVHLWQRRPQRARSSPHAPRVATPSVRKTVLFGLLAGFTTMVANAGGPVMTLYLLSAGFAMLGFLGTSAWFFLVVNVFKLPFSVVLGLVTPASLALDAALGPAVVLGALVGRACIRRMDQAWFDRLMVVGTVASSLNLLA